MNEELKVYLNGLFDEKLQPIRDDIRLIKTDIHELKADVQVLKADVHVLKEDVHILKADVQVLKDDVSILKSDVSEIKMTVGRIEENSPKDIISMLQVMNDKLDGLKGDIEYLGKKQSVNELETDRLKRVFSSQSS